MKEQRNSSISAGTPIKLRANANRQMEEQYSPRLTRTRQRADVLDDGIDDGWTVEKNHTSAVRYDGPSRRETNHLPPAKATKVITYRRSTLARFLVIFGLLLFFLALGVMAFNAQSNWWQLRTDDATYGRPRTYQTDQYVGHGDSNNAYAVAMVNDGKAFVGAQR